MNDTTTFLNNLDIQMKETLFLIGIKPEKMEFLSSEISNGKILKISFEGNIRNDEYETGALIMEPNSKIYSHRHDEYIETYSLISDSLVCFDALSKFWLNKFNLCKIGEEHCALNGNKFSVIIYTKIKVK